MKNSIVYIATAVDSNDLSSRPVVIGRFPTREEAVECVREDMLEYRDNYTWSDDAGTVYGPAVYDDVGFYVENFDGSASCRWAVTEANGADFGRNITA